MTDWTVEDATAILDPPMTVDQIRALIRACGLQPTGTRHTGRRGRPAPTYDSADLLRAHAGIARFLADGATPRA